jgi:S-adenosylmethionine decarboxylase
MKNLAPNIIRQRFLIEGFYQKEINVQAIKDYFKTVTDSLGLKMYGEPVIFSPGGEGREENQGYDAFVPLIDSGISLYVWANAKFFSLIIYTCKHFDETKALETTKKFFEVAKVESMSF